MKIKPAKTGLAILHGAAFKKEIQEEAKNNNRNRNKKTNKNNC